MRIQLEFLGCNVQFRKPWLVKREHRERWRERASVTLEITIPSGAETNSSAPLV
jgi:hypothetical protein